MKTNKTFNREFGILILMCLVSALLGFASSVIGYLSIKFCLLTVSIMLLAFAVKRFFRLIETL